ncbi:hypothetical protein EIP86_007114 [Pleurotus ostreatoroseus]|nr:hypothetical protein EIP86_007114 [Pleurotus ostreatoroseus]
MNCPSGLVYTRNTENIPLVGVRLGEIEAKTDEVTQESLRLHQYRSAAVTALINMKHQTRPGANQGRRRRMITQETCDERAADPDLARIDAELLDTWMAWRECYGPVARGPGKRKKNLYTRIGTQSYHKIIEYCDLNPGYEDQEPKLAEAFLSALAISQESCRASVKKTNRRHDREAQAAAIDPMNSNNTIENRVDAVHALNNLGATMVKSAYAASRLSAATPSATAPSAATPSATSPSATSPPSYPVDGDLTLGVDPNDPALASAAPLELDPALEPGAPDTWNMDDAAVMDAVYADMNWSFAPLPSMDSDSAAFENWIQSATATSSHFIDEEEDVLRDAQDASVLGLTQMLENEVASNTGRQIRRPYDLNRLAQNYKDATQGVPQDAPQEDTQDVAPDGSRGSSQKIKAQGKKKAKRQANTDNVADVDYFVDAHDPKDVVFVPRDKSNPAVCTIDEPDETDLLQIPIEDLRWAVAEEILKPYAAQAARWEQYEKDGQKWICQKCKLYTHRKKSPVRNWPSESRLIWHRHLHTRWYDLELEMVIEGSSEYRCPTESCDFRASSVFSVRAHCTKECVDRERYTAWYEEHQQRPSGDLKRYETRNKAKAAAADDDADKDKDVAIDEIPQTTPSSCRKGKGKARAVIVIEDSDDGGNGGGDDDDNNNVEFRQAVAASLASLSHAGSSSGAGPSGAGSSRAGPSSHVEPPLRVVSSARTTSPYRPSASSTAPASEAPLSLEQAVRSALRTFPEASVTELFQRSAEASLHCVLDYDDLELLRESVTRMQSVIAADKHSDIVDTLPVRVMRNQAQFDRVKKTL